MNTRMTSKSKNKSHLVREVTGKPVGLMRYFLNNTVSDLLDEGKVNSTKGLVFILLLCFFCQTVLSKLLKAGRPGTRGFTESR